jgi:hypothetical protein
MEIDRFLKIRPGQFQILLKIDQICEPYPRKPTLQLSNVDIKIDYANSIELMSSLLIICSSIYICLHNHSEGCITEVFATIWRRPFKMLTLFGVISVTGHL